jgi:hypothetical protein
MSHRLALVLISLVMAVALIIAGAVTATSHLLSVSQDEPRQGNESLIAGGSNSDSAATQQSDFSPMADNPDGRYSGPLSNGYGAPLLRRSTRAKNGSSADTFAAGGSPTSLPPVEVSFPVIALLLALASQILIGLFFILMGLRSRTSHITR